MTDNFFNNNIPEPHDNEDFDLRLWDMSFANVISLKQEIPTFPEITREQRLLWSQLQVLLFVLDRLAVSGDVNHLRHGRLLQGIIANLLQLIGDRFVGANANSEEIDEQFRSVLPDISTWVQEMKKADVRIQKLTPQVLELLKQQVRQEVVTRERQILYPFASLIIDRDSLSAMTKILVSFVQAAEHYRYVDPGASVELSLRHLSQSIGFAHYDEVGVVHINKEFEDMIHRVINQNPNDISRIRIVGVDSIDIADPRQLERLTATLKALQRQSSGVSSIEDLYLNVQFEINGSWFTYNISTGLWHGRTYNPENGQFEDAKLKL